MKLYSCFRHLAFPLFFCFFAAGCTSTQPPKENAYFLSAQQKLQLMNTGTIQDAKGNWYDVKVVPGYQPVFRRSKEYLVMAGTNLAEYVHREKYRVAGDAMRDIYDFSLRDAFWRWGIRGSGDAWHRRFANASDTVEKRAFGWWLAYPTAAIASTAESLWRITWGTVGGVGGVAIATVGVPAFAAVDSAAKATWHLGVDAIAIPAIEFSWNTLSAPPLALFGQKPSPERVDGWWVKHIRDPEGKIPGRLISNDKYISYDDLKTYANWAREMYITSRPFLAEQRQMEDAHHEKVNRIQQEANQAKAKVGADWHAQRDASKHAQTQAIYTRTRQLKEDGISVPDRAIPGDIFYQQRPRLREELERDESLSADDITEILNILYLFRPAPKN